MKNQLRIVISSIFVFVFLSFLYIINVPVFADFSNSSSNITITVNVTNKTLIDINPKALAWYNVEPGTESNNSYMPSTGEPMTKIQIENQGSRNVTKVWFSSSFPETYPAKTGDPSDYDAGNFVAVKLIASPNYHFVNRVDYNESEVAYLKLPTNVKSHGRFRNASNEYFWSLSGNTLNCSDTAISFRVGKLPHNDTSTGSTKLDSGTDYTELTGADLTTVNVASGTWAGSWAVGNMTIGGDEYCIAVNHTCERVVFYRFNSDVPGGGDGSGACALNTYLSETALVPGDWFVVDIRLRIPFGVPYGDVGNGILTVWVESDEVI